MEFSFSFMAAQFFYLKNVGIAAALDALFTGLRLPLSLPGRSKKSEMEPHLGNI
jgi:hypothetical protein